MEELSQEDLRRQIEDEIKANTDLAFEKSIASMSPFERKNLLIEQAKAGDKKDARTLLDAGRGNPNWICTLPREAFFLFGQFAVEESRRTMNLPAFDIAGKPAQENCAERFLEFLDMQDKNSEAAQFLRRCYDYVTNMGVDGDAFVMEWSEGIVGCEYPVPERILVNTQKIVRKYLVKAICDGKEPSQPFDLFATEGGTAAMCYLFYSLKCNFLVNPGDKMALMTPIFTPYLEIPHLNDYDLDVINVNATSVNKDGLHTWQYPDEELEKLADPSVKLLCVVNPSNPPSYAMDADSTKKLVEIVQQKNPKLMIITDDVYGTFVPHYRSLFSLLPHNTASVYSFSKYFGATGWRLATIAISEDNVFDELISALPEEKKAILRSRYSSLTDKLDEEMFIDRMVADSRLVALNGTAGLSTPQQVQMDMFALYCLLDTEDIYKNRMHQLVNNRLTTLWKSLGLTLAPDPLRAGYYSIIDLDMWATKLYGAGFAKWLKENYDSSDIVLRMAEDTGIVLMDGTGFDAPDWSVRVSLANLDVKDYETIGTHLMEMFDDYHDVWVSEQLAGKVPVDTSANGTDGTAGGTSTVKAAAAAEAANGSASVND